MVLSDRNFEQKMAGGRLLRPIFHKETLDRPRRNFESDNETAHSGYRVQESGCRMREPGIGFRIQEEEILGQPPGSVEPATRE
jgi:hypothetical protein